MWTFSYLAGGANFADIADLTWNEYYFNSGEKELQFIRKKTLDTSDGDLEILIPIIPELRRILSLYGSTPELGKRVFPWIYGTDNPNEEEIIRKVQQLNSLRQFQVSTYLI